MRAEKLRIEVDKVRFGAGYGLYIFQGENVARSLEFSRQKEGEMIDPVISLYPNEAQVLMDSLWDAGLRPAQGEGGAGSLLATQSHLKDMRLIAGKKLGVELG